MNLTFFESLSPEQKTYANKIAERARQMGLPPELAVAVAYQESRLNPAVGVGGAGEIGIMQIKPATAREMGYTLDDIKDPVKNIDAGLTYLKKSYELSQGDPRLAAAGYNAGVNHPFFTPRGDKLPDPTVKYLGDLKGYGAFQAVPPATAEAASEEIPRETRIATEDIGQRSAEQIGSIAGGAAGSALTGARVLAPVVKPAVRGAAALASKVMSPAARQAAELIGGQRSIGPVAQPPVPGGQMAAGLADEAAQISRILQGTTDPTSGTTGRARMGGFNLETAQQAARGKQAAETVGALQRAGLVSQSAKDILAAAPGMTASPEGIAYPRSAPSGPIAPPPTPSRGALEAVSDLFKSMMGSGSLARGAIRYAAPPLAGMQIGSDIATFGTELGREEPDYTKAGLAALGALGAGASMFPLTAPIGIPIAIGAPLIQSYRERTKGALPTTTETVAP